MGGAAPVEVFRSRDYMLVYETEKDILKMVPDHPALAKINTLGIIVTAPGKDVDFVSRFFAPAAGVPEDPVTGSAHATLIPYWAQQLDKTEMTAVQLSKRKGHLWCG